MLKTLILSLALTVGLKADVVGPTMVNDVFDGIGGVPASSLTYALNQALTGTSSSAIDLSGTSGAWLTLTSTGQSLVAVYFSNSNVTYTTGAIQTYLLQSPGAYPIPPKSRYMSLVNVGTKPTAKVSAFYYTLTSVTGSITANIPAGSGLSITAQPVFNSLSSTTVSWLTQTATVLNLTTVAGVNVRCNVCFSPRWGGSGINLAWGTSASAPSDLSSVGFPIATSATGQCFGPYAPGTNFYVISTGAVSVTGKLQVDGVY